MLLSPYKLALFFSFLKTTFLAGKKLLTNVESNIGSFAFFHPDFKNTQNSLGLILY